MQTYWNCSRCHWCLRSRPLQSNQRETSFRRSTDRRHRGTPVATQCYRARAGQQQPSEKPRPSTY